MPVLLQATLLVICSNVFMTFAWYAHLKDMSGRPWFIAALVSWGVALAAVMDGTVNGTFAQPQTPR